MVRQLCLNHRQCRSVAQPNSLSREFEITTRPARGPGHAPQTSGASGFGEGDSEEDDEDIVHGRRSKVGLRPWINTTHTIHYEGHWLHITRSRNNEDKNRAYYELTISVVARSNAILKQLVLEAKKGYEKDSEHRVQIFMADSRGSWLWSSARQKVC